MLRPLLVMPEQLSYLHHVCTRIMGALSRIPDLFVRDPDVRKILPLAPDEAAWFEETWAQIEPGRESALWPARRRLRFHERALAGLAALHGAEPVGRRRHSSRAVGRDAADARRRARDPRARPELDASSCRAISATCSCRCCSITRRAIGRPSANLCLIEPKYVAEGPNEQSHLVSYYQSQRGITLHHADPRELRLVDGEVYYEDTVVDVAYRDYELRDLLALEREHGQHARRDPHAVPAEPHGVVDRGRPRSQDAASRC